MHKVCFAEIKVLLGLYIQFLFNFKQQQGSVHVLLFSLVINRREIF